MTVDCEAMSISLHCIPQGSPSSSQFTDAPAQIEIQLRGLASRRIKTRLVNGGGRPRSFARDKLNGLQ
jgi:hypothetical protein